MHCGSVFGDHTHTRIHSWQKIYLLVPPSNLMCQRWKMLLALLYVHTFLVQTLSTSKAGKNLWSPQEVPRKSPGSPQEVSRKSPGSPVSAVTRLLVRNVMFLLTLSGRAVTANLENPESQHRMHVIWGKSGFPHMDVVTRWRILHIITTSVPIWILVFLNSTTQTLVSVNSLTDIDAHERQLFHDLHCSLVTSLICVLYKCLIARKIVELFNFNHGKRPFYAACSLSELRRRFVLCLWIASFEKGFHNTATWFFTPKSMTMTSAGAIQFKYLPDGGVQRHLG